MTYKEEKDICNHCKDLRNCKLSVVGFTPVLEFNNKYVELTYVKCKHNTFKDDFDNLQAVYIPKKVFEANLEDFDLIGPSRKTINNYILRFLKEYSRKNFVKGMYISGSYGTGKTYVLAALANELAKLGHKVYFAYFPDLAREIKSSIGDGSLEDKIEKIKKVEILMLDDIGGEHFSEFVRDEVLGPILQHRLLDNLPTFFTSNLGISELAKSMKKTDNHLDTVASYRIVERIKRMVEMFSLLEKPHIS